MNRRLPLTLLFFLAIPCQMVHGQPTAPQSDCTNNPACVALYDQAVQQTSASQLAAALRSFKLAYEVEADPKLLYSIARIMHLQGQETEAIPYYRRFIDSNLDDPAQKAKAQEYLAQCEAIAADAAAKKQEAERLEKEGRLQANRIALPPKPVPVYKKWWLWAIVGTVAAAGIASGIAGGIIANQNQIPEPSFRPF
jgi:tetratricopeptide (TPR) repeat protein